MGVSLTGVARRARTLLGVMILAAIVLLPVTGPNLARRFIERGSGELGFFAPRVTPVSRGSVEARFDLTGVVVAANVATVLAPVTGVVTAKLVANGQEVSAGQSVLEVTPADGGEPRAVSSAGAGVIQNFDIAIDSDVSTRSPVAVVEGPERAVEAEVSPRLLYSFGDRPVAIEGTLLGGLGSFACEFQSLGRDAASGPDAGAVRYVLRCGLPAGFRALVGSDAQLSVVAARAEDVLTVPRTAVEMTASEAFVVRVQGSDRERVPVTVGVASERQVEVTTGLVDGDLVLDPAVDELGG